MGTPGHDTVTSSQPPVPRIRGGVLGEGEAGRGTLCCRRFVRPPRYLIRAFSSPPVSVPLSDESKGTCISLREFL
ncbi:hypothetical protein E2C01_055356 [Portunus trituberculatus]|uniref:Uncharacterized protein n=1 Tax=Portunus trituberculatus TaxID=210409 RepID=A0A5B7GVP9_PORTR|nr:hypothetical protein [Portunus trituberculatus]